MDENCDDGSNDGEREQGSDGAASIASVSEHEANESQEQGSEVGSEIASAPQSPSGSEGGQQSDEEVHISEAEASDQSDNEGAHSEKDAAADESGKEDQSSEKGDASDRESVREDNSDNDENEETIKENDDRAEDSDQEGSVPEINIDSGDEDNDQRPESRTVNAQDSESENEAERDAGASDNEKGSDQDDDEEGSLVIADDVEPMSDAENANSDNEKNANSDDENANSDDEKQPASEKGSLHSPASPMPDSDNEEKVKKMDSDDDDDDDKPSSTGQGSTNTPEKVEVDEAADKDDSDGDNDANSDSEESNVGDLIANIFGESDDEEFEGFAEEEVAAVALQRDKRLKAKKVISDSEDEDDGDKEAEAGEPEAEPEVTEESEAPPAEEMEEVEPPKATQAVSDDDSDDDGVRKMREDFVSDFDLMMQKKKDESSRRRKRKDVDIINDSDDLIAEIIAQMRHAADEDRLLNKQKKTATKKLRILPLVLSQLKKQDLKMAFLDQGVLNTMADWLAPLPDRSLPHLQIREGMIRQLSEFPGIDQHLLKSSGVGRALMYLFRHPRETKENKERAGKLITEWARPIFNVTTNYHSLTKEEREQRDFDHIPKKKKLKDPAEEDEANEERKDIDKALTGEDKTLRPGEKGWVGRARVPAPSTRDYVVRPKWNVEMEFGRGPGKKPLNRFEKHIKVIQEKKRQSKGQRAVTCSIEGRKMPI